MCVDMASVGRDHLLPVRNEAAQHQTEWRDDTPKPQEIREDKTKKGESREQ